MPVFTTLFLSRFWIQLLRALAPLLATRGGHIQYLSAVKRVGRRWRRSYDPCPTPALGENVLEPHYRVPPDLEGEAGGVGAAVDLSCVPVHELYSLGDVFLAPFLGYM
jgi:hypothetical protein